MFATSQPHSLKTIDLSTQTRLVLRKSRLIQVEEQTHFSLINQYILIFLYVCFMLIMIC